MNDQGYKELMLRIIITDNIQLIKNEDNQKTIVLEGIVGEKLIDFLENKELSIKYCRLCDLIIPDHSTIDNHIQLKSHKRTRDELNIKEAEDH